MRKKVRFHNKNIILLIMIYAFIVLIFKTTSSPLFLMNEWVDVNAYFTMGRGIINGLVPYRDLFDHKGPLLYFITAMEAMISDKTFMGMYIIQSLTLGITFTYIYKSFLLFNNAKKSLMGLMGISLIILLPNIYNSGGSAEEYILMFQTISLYYIMRYFIQEKNKVHSEIVMYIHGITSACVLMIKYNLIIFWIPFGLVIFLKLLADKKYAKFLKNFIALILGVLSVVGPIVSYFIYHNSLKEFIEGYFIFNIRYGTGSGTSGMIENALRAFWRVNTKPMILVILIIIGIYYLTVINKNITIWGKGTLISTIILTYIGVYGSGKTYAYYYLGVCIFCMFGIQFFIEKFITEHLRTKEMIFFCISVFLVSTNIISNSNNYIFTHRENPQMKFSKIMNQEENPTLLNLLSLDGGFYNAANIVPNVKYYYLPNISYSDYPEIIDNQYEYIRDKNVRYVVRRTRPNNNSEHEPDYIKKIMNMLNQNYYELTYEDYKGFRYTLYKIRENSINEINEFNQYIKELDNDDYIIIMSSKDEMSKNLTEENIKQMAELGLQIDMRQNYRQSYLAIINDGHVIYEQSSPDKTEYNVKIENLDINMLSAGYSAGNYSSIVINGKEYSQNQRGLNIVVYSKNERKVIDSVVFDTFKDNTATRKIL